MVQIECFCRKLLDQLFKVIQPHIDRCNAVICLSVTMYESSGSSHNGNMSKTVDRLGDLLRHCKVTQQNLQAKLKEYLNEMKRLETYTQQYGNLQCVTNRWYVYNVYQFILCYIINVYTCTCTYMDHQTLCHFV
jgi:hypothetical protein